MGSSRGELTSYRDAGFSWLILMAFDRHHLQVSQEAVLRADEGCDLDSLRKT